MPHLFLGHEKVVRALIELGAKVDAESGYNWTPIHYAAHEGRSVLHTFIRSCITIFLITSLGREKVVRALVELGARVDAEDGNKGTPLHSAAEWGKSLICLQSNILVLIVASITRS